VDLLKNISPPLGVIPKTHLFSIKIPPPLGVVLPKCIPYAVMLRNETSRNIAYLKKQINLDYFGVQFLHLRCRMTRSYSGEPYRFFSGGIYCAKEFPKTNNLKNKIEKTLMLNT